MLYNLGCFRTAVMEASMLRNLSESYEYEELL